MRDVPVGLQLYSVREECAADLPGTLAAVARMGYQGVEFAGYHGRTAADLRRLLDDLGLRCCGTHTRLDTILGPELQRTADFAAELGHHYLIVPSLPPERRASRQAWLETAELFNEAAERAAAMGMVVGYHNHSVEFQPFPGDPSGEVPWDTFFSNTRREVVMQVDFGNALAGGGDPFPCIARYPARALTVHLKEHSRADPTALLGEGEVDWPSVLTLCAETGGTEWFIVEQETYAVPPLECVRRCLLNLRRIVSSEESGSPAR